MSYILDALKKSEQERGHGNVPGVQTVHSSSLNYRNEKRSYWPYILISAVILNFAAIVYFIVDKKQEAVKTAEVILEKDIEVATRELDTTDTTDLITDKIESRQAPAATSTAVETTAISDTATTPSITKQEKFPAVSKQVESDYSAAIEDTPENNSDIIEFFDLPESIQQQLPAIIVSAHVYSENPLQRSIVINNNFLEEGEYVLDDLILYEITPDGAVFDYKDTRFHYGIVNSWQ